MNQTNRTPLSENVESRRFSLKRAGSVILVVCLCLAAIYVFWISLNFYTYHRLYTDSGVFAAVSNHVLNGKVLYKDVWDHKPPAIYLINALPLIGGDGSVIAIRYYERFFAIAGAVALFCIVLIAYKTPLFAFWAALAFNVHFYNPVVFQGGNLTEEYGVIFILIAIFGLLASHSFIKKYSFVTLQVSGFFFSLAVFTKETFLLSTIPWIVYLLLHEDSPGLSRFRKCSLFSCGFGIPILIFLTLSLWMGNLDGWLDVLCYNVQYAQQSRAQFSWNESFDVSFQRMAGYVVNQTLTVRIFCLLGAASCIYIPFVKKYSYFPWACLAAFAFDFAAASIGGYDIGHYYLQTIPSYVLTAVTGCAFLLYLFPSFRLKEFVFLVCLLLAFIVLDSGPLELYKERLTARPWHPPNGMITNTILECKRDGDTLWAGRGENAKYYQETGLLSPSKFIYVYDHLFLHTISGTGEEKKVKLTNDLMKVPPTFMILSQGDFQHFREIGLVELVDWIERNYSPVPGVGDSGIGLYCFCSNP